MRTPSIFPAATSILLLCAGCSPTGSSTVETAEPALGPAVDLSRIELVDLSYTYDDTTLYWPTSTERFEHTELAYGPSDGGWFYSSYAYSSPEHGGTHLDAPIHFHQGGWTADRIPLDHLVAPAIVIDVAEAAAADRDYLLRRADVEAWESANGPVPGGSIVLLRTGWGKFWPEALEYLGDDTPGDASNLHFPSYGKEAAEYLIGERDVAALGVDTASIDYGASQDFIVHQIAGAANVLGLENVANLGELPAKGFWVAALPMKIGAGSGGPVRIVGLLPRG